MKSEWEQLATAQKVEFFPPSSIQDHLITQHGLVVRADEHENVDEKADAKHKFDHSRSEDGLFSGPLIKHEH